MATGHQTAVVGVFEDVQHARDAIRDLRNAGFDADHIGLISHEKNWKAANQIVDEEPANTDEAAAAGAAAGAGVGALWGLGIVAGMLPAIGPAIVGGTLGMILSSAVAGAAVAGLGGALIGMGVPDDEAKYYESEFKTGRTLVTVDTDMRHDEAVHIMQRNGGYDIRTRDTYRDNDLYRRKMGRADV